jgi:hypothetical protein
MAEEEFTPERSRQKLLAAISATAAAATGMVELLRTADGVEDALREGLTWDVEAFIPQEEEIFEPLVDALRLAIHAIGLPSPLHGISLALDRFSEGTA